MNANVQRFIALVTLLAGLVCPTRAQAQAPVVSNNSLTTVAAVAQKIPLYLSAGWSVAQTYDKRLTYTNFTQPAHGVITWEANYYGNANYYCYYTCTNLTYTGSDSFVWRCAYGSLTSGLATCFITVATNTPPVAQTCSFFLPPGTTNVLESLYGFVSHPDADAGQTMTYFVRSQPIRGGSVSMPYGSLNAYYAYCAPPGFSGTDTFTWAVSDGIATSAPASCSIIVTANTVPVATPCSFSVPSGVTVTNTMPYTDPDSGQTYTAIVMSQPAHGVASVDSVLGGVSVNYCCSTPGFLGTDTFTFAISDGMSISAPALCTMNVTPGPPVALAQTVVTMKNTPIVIPLSFSGGGGYTCWPAKVTSPNPGTLTTNGNVFVYTPKTNWLSTTNSVNMTPDSFTWKMAYSNAVTPLTNSATVTCKIVVKDVGSNTNCDWTQWRFDECRTAQSPLVLSNKLYLQWQRTLPACAGAFDSFIDNDLDQCRPVQLGKQLFVPLLANDSLSAYNTDTGAQNWRYYASGVVRRPPVAVTLANGTNVVIFGSDDGNVYCLNVVDGSVVWKFQAAPANKRAMVFGRQGSVWPVWGSPVVSSNRVYIAAGYVPMWNLFVYCLDAASGLVIWKDDGRILQNGFTSVMGPLAISTDHVKLYGTMDAKCRPGWSVSLDNGQWMGYLQGQQSAKGVYAVNWYVDGSGYVLACGSPASGCSYPSAAEPPFITAGGQTFTPTTAAGLGVQGTIGNLLAGDGKLFVTTTKGTLYCFGGTNVAVPVNYPLPAIVPLPAITDAWTAVVSRMLTNRPDLQQGLALVWGVGSGRLVEELTKQATNLEIVACDPDTNKLYNLRVEMDAAGWSGAHVSTVQGNPMDCGFAPYQATLIASEDITVAGYSNGMAFAKLLYKCVRPFYGEVWMPTANAQQYTAIASWLTALNLPSCGGSNSYAVYNRTDMTVPGVNGFTQIRRLGLPDACLNMKPPFRLTAVGAAVSESGAVGFTPNPVPSVKGVLNGYDIYNWLPVSATQNGYEPAPAWNNGYYSLNAKVLDYVFNSTLTNALFARTECQPVVWNNIQGCKGAFRTGNTLFAPGKFPLLADGANYWGIMLINAMGGCWGGQSAFVGDGTAAFTPSSGCGCNYNETLSQIGFVPTDEANEEAWVIYCTQQSMKPIQEIPIQSIGVNFGAPNDRWDEADQLLWTHHPYFGYEFRRYVCEAPSLIAVGYGGATTNIYHSSAAMTTTSSNYHGWVSASYVEGMTNMTIPLAQPLLAIRTGTPPLMDGTLTSACWQGCSQIDLYTSCGGTNGTRSYCMLCYDSTNLYVAGVLHQQGARPATCPAYMRVGLGGRDQPLPPLQVTQLCYGDTKWSSGGLSADAWKGAYTTNLDMFRGEIAIPWASLAAAGIWTSQLVMNVEICGNLLCGNLASQGAYGLWGTYSTNLLSPGGTIQSLVTTSFTPVYLDAARGPVTEVIPHRVRLYFAEMEGLTNGQRVFDVLLQGQTVLTNFDIFFAAGGKNCCEVVREFNNIGIADKLNIDFVAHTGQPILGGVEIIATGTNAPNQPPVAIIDASTLSGPCPLDVQFSAQRSYDPDGQVIECAWDTGDGRVAHGSTLHHIFAEPGTNQVCLLVTDNRGAKTATTVPVVVTPGVPAAFVINMRSNKAPNCDFSNFMYWNSTGWGVSGNMPCDLTSSTMVFQVSSTGNYTSADNGTAVTFTGGKTGILRYVASWVTNAVTNIYVAVVNVGGTGTVNTGTITAKSGHTLTISDTGTQTTSLLFTVSATNNYVASKDDGQTVIFNGGGMGVLRHINQTATQIAMITECRGLIQPGTVTCATGHTFVVSDTGHPVCTVIVNGFNDWTNGLNATVALSSTWLTDPNHCLVIRAAPGQGHAGAVLGTNGCYSGFALTVPVALSTMPNMRISQIIVVTNTITVGNGSSVNRVLGSVAVAGNGVTVANSIGAAFAAKSTGIYPGNIMYQDISFHNCTGGSFTLADVTLNRIRMANCLAYTNAGGFVADITQSNLLQELWLSSCVSLDNSATASDGWKDGNSGNKAGQTISFVNTANNDYRLAAGDTGARGMGQPGLGADVTGNLRLGPMYDVGAYQSTNVMSAFQQWQMQYYGSFTAPNAASNAVNSAGISNYQMFLAGSNPNDSNTWFRFTGVAPTGGNKWRMNFNTVSGKLYSVNWKTNLLDGLGWVFYTNFSGLGGSTQVTFTNSLPQAFFQIQAQ